MLKKKQRGNLKQQHFWYVDLQLIIQSLNTAQLELMGFQDLPDEMCKWKIYLHVWLFSFIPLESIVYTVQKGPNIGT